MKMTYHCVFCILVVNTSITLGGIEPSRYSLIVLYNIKTMECMDPIKIPPHL